MISKKQPDVLRVVEFVLAKAAQNEAFSVQSATKSKELNGLTRHQLARIMRDICLDPDDDGSLERNTTVDSNHSDGNPCYWQLNANAYFGYLSYLAVQHADKSNKIAVSSHKLADKTNRIATYALYVSIIASLTTLISLVLSALGIIS